MFSEYAGVTSSGKKKVVCWSDKNEKRPHEVSISNGKTFWFDCDKCPHDFCKRLCKIKSGQWCPYCVQKLCDDDCGDCFNKSFASYDGVTSLGKKKVDCWNADKNVDSKGKKIEPRYRRKHSSIMFCFDCDNCPHTFESPLAGITRGRWCPYCCHSPRLCDNPECEICFNRSFASFEAKKVACWSDKNVDSKGKKIEPRDVAQGSSMSCWFDCDECPHPFESTLDNIKRGGTWCPYCSNQKRCDKEDCDFCFNNSFASYDGKLPSGKKKIFYWSKKNKQQPRDIAISCNKKFYFDCVECLHEFEHPLSDITSSNAWCPYCCHQKMCFEEDCVFCYNNSFASSSKKILDCWNADKNVDSEGKKIKPREVAIHSSQKCYFDCDKCSYPFNSTISHITNGTWCPTCKESKGERKITEYIQSLGYPNMSQKKFELCRDKHCLPFDNMIEDCNTLIEFDGGQHFESIEFFGGKTAYTKRRMHDVMKNKFCLENNYLLLRIAHTEIDYIEQLIDRAIYMHSEDKTGIIFSNPSLYKGAYL